MKILQLVLSCFLGTLWCNSIYASHESMCEITSFTANYVENSCENGWISIEFDFEATEFGLNGFTVWTTDYEDYNLGDEYVVFAVAECDEEIVVTITDNDDPSCTASVTLEPACCDCEISDPVFSISECENGMFDVGLDLFDTNGTCDWYGWFLTLEGVNYPLVWSNDNQQFEAFNLSAEASILNFELCSDGPLDECFTYEIDNPCFVDCNINSFFAGYVDNSCEGEIIIIEFEFDATDFGINGFTVSANGSTQTYNLGDDYSLIVLSDCAAEVDVVITDLDNPDCTATYFLPIACCECDYTSEINFQECVDGTFDVEIDLLIAGGSCLFYDWYIDVEGELYVLEFVDGLYVASGVTVNTDSEEFLFSICNPTPSFNCIDYIFENPCFMECSLFSFNAEYDQESCVGEIIYVDFEFEGENFGLDGFEVSHDGNSTFYNLNDDYTYIILSDCLDDVVLTITDVQSPDCTSTITLDPACCDCVIADPVIEASACNNELFNLTIDDFLESGTCLTYEWFVEIEDVDYELNWNGQAYEVFDISSTLSQSTVLLCNTSPLQECFTFIVDNPCFVPISDCTINSFEAGYLENSCSGEIVFFEFDFEAENFGLDGFLITANGDTQLYNLGDDYLFAIISDCAEDVIVTIIDEADPTCQFVFNLGPACCECVIEEPSFITTDCDNGSFNLFIDFFDSEGTCINYDWFISYNGLEFDLTLNPVTQLYEASSFISSDSLFTFSLCNNSPLNECWTYELVNPCYEPEGEECSINSFLAEFDTSTCDGELIFLDFEFDADNFGEDGFIVSSGEFSQAYNIGDDYTFATVTLCTEDVIVSIADANDPSCQANINLGPACCPCEIEEPNIQVSACNNNIFNIFIDAFDFSGSCENYIWYLQLEGNIYELVWNPTNQNYETLSLTASDSVFTLLLCNDSPLNECYSYNFVNPCYVDEESECMINSFTAEYVIDSCVGELIYIEFDFDATDFGLGGFSVNAGGDTQIYEVDDEYTMPIISDCNEDVIVTISDLNDTSCMSEVNLGPACCECFIDEPAFISECNNDSIVLEILFFNYEGSCINYDWFVVIDSIEYDLIWDGANYLVLDIVSQESFIEINICNAGPLNECFSYTIDNPCYVDEVECMIDTFITTVDTVSCDTNGDVVLGLDFEINNGGSMGYNVSVDGIDYGIFDYPPGTEISIPSNCNEPSIITIQDVELIDCNWTSEVMACCPIIDSVNDAEKSFVNISYDLNGDIIISNQLDQRLNAILYSINGMTISETEVLRKENQKIILKHIPKGIYVLSISNEIGQIQTHKVWNVSY